MTLVEVLKSQKSEYNEFVAGHISGSFLQSWEWGDWQKSLGRDICRYWILDINDNKVGAAQLIKMPIFGKYFYLYSPYGPVGVDEFRVMGEELVGVLKEKFPNAVFVRVEPKLLSTNHLALSTKTTNIQPGKTLVVDLLKSEEQFLSAMHHKTRYNIKLAQKHRVEIKDEFDISIGHGLFFDEALRLILQTAGRQKFNTFPGGYYKKLVDFFVLHNNYINSGESAEASAKADKIPNGNNVKLHIYKAIYKNKLLSAAIMIDFGNTRTYLFGGSSDEDKNVMAPYLLHWQAMLDAKSAGLSFYDLWGIETASGKTPGFVRFKLGFGGAEKQYAGAYDLVIAPGIYKIYKLFRSLNKVFR